MADRRVPSVYADIAAAVAAANDDDRVLLELAGSPFTGANNRGIATNKRLTIEGEEAGIEVDLEDSDGFLLLNFGGPLLASFSIKNLLFKNGFTNPVLQIYTVSDFLLEDCVFNDSESTGLGTALFVVGTAGLVNRCAFNRNYCAGPGGATFIGGPSGTFTFRHTSFIDNKSAANGGAMSWSGGPLIVLENCLFDYNLALINGGAIASTSVDTDIRFCTFVRNRASGVGGGWYITDGAIFDYNFEDCIVWGNSSGLREGNQIYILNPSASIVNLQNVLYENGKTSDIYGTFASEVDSLNGDPLFILSSDFHLQQPPSQTLTSPAVNSGSVDAIGSVIEGRTTRSDEYNDDGVADRGYHYVGNDYRPLAGEIASQSTIEGRASVPDRYYLEIPEESLTLTIVDED